jgi:ABC-type antimicrobial peptide transport system permease subunit
MLRNYIKIAWRSLWKSRLLTSVNILGLSVAFAVSILLALTAFRELSYDRFHRNHGLQQLYISVHQSQGLEERSNMPMPLTPAIKQEFPEVKVATRLIEASGSVRYKDKTFGSDVRAVDPDFLSMFTFPLIKGETRQPLSDLSNIVITEKMARAIYGEEEPVGKPLEIYMDNRWETFTVSAVARDIPDNSSIDFDILCRFEHAPGYEGQKNSWNSSTHEVFLQLNDNATAAAFERRARSFVNKYFTEQLRDLQRDGAKAPGNEALIALHLIPLQDIHFNSISSSGGEMSRVYPYLLLLIAGFILFIACVNFMNLTIAGALGRSREIGMRKILGAFQGQLVIQLWGEAVLACLLALAAGVLITYLILPGYNALFSNHINLTLLKHPLLLLSLVFSFLAVTLVAGGYPAWIIARLNTIKVLKGSLETGKSNRVRNTLMLTQFVISSLLICCTLIAWQQLNYLRKQPLGYNKEQVLSIPVPDNVNTTKALQHMRNMLSGQTGILSITGTDINMGRGRDGSSATSVVSFDYQAHTVRSNWLRIDYDYVKTLGLQLVAGRDFSRAYGTDSTGLVINEKMAAQLGGNQAALGARLPVGDSAHPFTVIGIVRDFNFRSLKEEIGPLSMHMHPSEAIRYIFVKVSPYNLPASLAMVQQRWKTAYPENRTEVSFLDENTDRQYRKEQQFSSIFMSAAVLAIIISCMGLFTISVLVMTKRTREIGVRKVLGASVVGIVTLLSRDFIRLVSLSVIIASPIAWYLMEKWLQDYPYRIHINIGVFIVAGALALLIAIITVSVQAIRAALMNPVKSIRTE